VIDVARAQSLRHEQFHRLTDELTRLVTEQLRGPPVGKRDDAAGIDEQDGVRGGLEQRAKASLRGAALTDITNDRDHDRLGRFLHGLRLISTGNSLPSSRSP
jgi:hypothetical protein